MALSVLQVAYPYSPVRSGAVGGAEQVLYTLDRGLTRRGHRSMVIACNGSQVQGTLWPCGAGPESIGSEDPSGINERLRTLIEYVLHTHEVDLVHFHGLDFHQYLPRTQRPILVTLHLPIRHYPESFFGNATHRYFFNCVSRSQHRTCRLETRMCPPIPNGVILGDFTPTLEKENYLLSLGRVCPEKGFHLALRAAHESGLPLIVAGSVFPFPEHVRYFNERIVPLLDENRRFIGPVGPMKRAQLLCKARALLVPSLIEETSSLVTMEALASGTPVIAFPSGALPEVVDHGRTGLLVDDLSTMVDAIRAIDTIDPLECRRTAERRFCADRMTDAYVELYHALTRRMANVG